jgi:hypothetical protein
VVWRSKRISGAGAFVRILNFVLRAAEVEEVLLSVLEDEAEAPRLRALVEKGFGRIVVSEREVPNMLANLL